LLCGTPLLLFLGADTLDTFVSMFIFSYLVLSTTTMVGRYLALSALSIKAGIDK